MHSASSPKKTPPRPAGLCARADLVSALAVGDHALACAIAELSDRVWVPSRPKPEASDPQRESLSGHEGVTDAAPVPKPNDQPLLPARFWRVQTLETSLSSQELADTATASGTPAYAGWTNRPRIAPLIPPLAEWRELEPRLRGLLCLFQRGQGPDLDLAVRRISHGEFIAELPRERRRRWGPALYLIEDRSERLIPCRLDQHQVHEALRALIPGHALQRLVLRDGQEPSLGLEAAVSGGEGLPPPGSLVLVLGDLGCLAKRATALTETWRRIGRDLRAAGCTPVVLLPAPLERCPPALGKTWDLIAWERPRSRPLEDSLAERATRLLRLVSPAVRIEPGLLRAARLLLPPSAADAGTESDVWQHPDLQSRSPVGATLDPTRAHRLRKGFSELSSDLQRRFAALLRAWRGHLPEEIWFEELLNLPQAVRNHPELATDQALARRYFAELAHRPQDAIEGMSGSDRSWFGRVEQRAGAEFWEDAEVGRPLQRLSWQLHQRDPGFQPPYVLDPALIRQPQLPLRRLQLRQRGGALQLASLAQTDQAASQDSPLAELRTQNGLIQVEPRFERAPGFWETCEIPAWATDWGWDENGAWVEFSLEGKDCQPATQRMRWIAPGTFLMGSPESEPERIDWEGPQHEVRIRDGFWLFDTACTQALWEAVMGGNPSRFKGPEHPVEQVSWEDAQHFIETINGGLPGLALSLPSEAQWEYACRAGTQTAFSVGDTITPDQVNYDGNYPYAGGPKGLYRGETIPVKALDPNAWGLYQMHGNVDEWVQDAWHGSYQGAPSDGSAWESAEAGAGRVVRGGSWGGGARGCRSAFRLRIEPDYRVDGLGFRCARAQVREPGRSEAERAELARPGPRSGSGRGGTDPARGAGQERAAPVLLRLDVAAAATVELLDAPALEIRTDHDILRLQRCAKPEWASAMGRDRFGLWAEIRIEPSLPKGRQRSIKRSGKATPIKSATTPAAPVIQRLRWIPPGDFTMGSPPDEPGRYDDEGPQHSVTIGQGFWLFSTPCTQALWIALGLKNASRFQDPSRPVEQVSWNDVQQKFLPALNERIPGFSLPSEAQWEYACRAGTQTALYTGAIEILGERNAPALDAIAWYGGNSGVGFELDNGEDSSSWPEQQYPHARSGSHPVGKKQPNPWGLYDMIGNVYEWTQDTWHDRYEGSPADGSAWEATAAGAFRVVRGGSWLGDARNCRSAFRLQGEPDIRDGGLGFRCARAQVT